MDKTTCAELVQNYLDLLASEDADKLEKIKNWAGYNKRREKSRSKYTLANFIVDYTYDKFTNIEDEQAYISAVNAYINVKIGGR